MKVYFIYTLACPFTGKVVYIGKTSTSLEARLASHFYSFHCGKLAEWMVSLRKTKTRPTIELLDTVNESNVNDAELFWIHQFAVWEFPLLNQAGNFKCKIKKRSFNNPN